MRPARRFRSPEARRCSTDAERFAPHGALDNLVRLNLVLEELRTVTNAGAMALRCWTELQKRYGISPCLVTGRLAELGLPVSCEVDIANAIVMHALGAASGAIKVASARWSSPTRA